VFGAFFQILSYRRHIKEETMNDTNQDRQGLSMIPGIIVVGCIVVGIAGLIGAAVAISDFKDPTGGGVCLLASAVVFGLAANAVFRK
jgi:hypothetical protein